MVVYRLNGQVRAESVSSSSYSTRIAFCSSIISRFSHISGYKPHHGAITRVPVWQEGCKYPLAPIRQQRTGLLSCFQDVVTIHAVCTACKALTSTVRCASCLLPSQHRVNSKLTWATALSLTQRKCTGCIHDYTVHDYTVNNYNAVYMLSILPTSLVTAKTIVTESGSISSGETNLQASAADKRLRFRLWLLLRLLSLRSSNIASASVNSIIPNLRNYRRLRLSRNFQR